jgi:hypothetical protein
VPAQHEEDAMPQYLLSVHSVDGEVRDPMTDTALVWASRVTGAIKAPIEVRPFAATEA